MHKVRKGAESAQTILSTTADEDVFAADTFNHVFGDGVSSDGHYSTAHHRSSLTFPSNLSAPCWFEHLDRDTNLRSCASLALRDMLKALIYAYVLGGLTFIPLVALAVLFITIYTSVPVGDGDVDKQARGKLEAELVAEDADVVDSGETTALETNDLPKTRKGWLTMRRTFEESAGDGGYVTLVRSFLDSRSKDPKRSRPKDMWYVVLKGKVLYLYEDEEMTECEAVVELGSHDVVVYPAGQTDGEMFAKRNAICLKPKSVLADKVLPTATREMKLEEEGVDAVLDGSDIGGKQREKVKEKIVEGEKRRTTAAEKELNAPAPWFIFVRSNVEMEDWYLALIHASDNPAQTPTLSPLQAVFRPADMNHLVSTLDEQPDVIPMRWLNALIGRIFFSYYRTQTLEAYIIGRLMKKLSKVKRPAFLADVVVTEVSVGSRPPMFSKPMLKELTKEGDASLEVHMHYKGEFRITIEATAIINLGQFKSYTVKLVLAAVLKELEGNLLVKVKRPPSNRIWYAFTQSPRMVLEVEPIVSDRQIKWGMILSTIESKLKEIIQESVVMPNMDDIAFFDSHLYEHRGGIWSDASRTETARTSSPVPAPDDMQSTVSAPPVIPSESSPEGVPLPSDRSPGSHEPENSESRPASVIPIVYEQDTPMKEQDLLILMDKSRSEPSLSDEQRGRSPSIHSVVQSSRDIPPEIFEPVQDVTDDFAQGSPSSRSRTPSVHSVKSYKSGKSTETTPDASTTPRKSSETSREPPTSPSPSSFLSTLKSKAGDKQALSNTARETMRKWGVNWTNLKKEFNSEENGDIASKLRSKMDGSSNKRASYAEVRAAVAERRERERSSGAEEEGSSSRSTSPGEEGARNETQPNLPTGQQQAGKRSFTSPVIASKKSLPSVSRVNTDIDATDDISEDEVRPTPIQAQPQAKTMTIPGIHASHKGEVMSMGYVAPQPSLLSESVKSKNPAIQSVYRLWRNPVDAGEDTTVSGKRTGSEVEAPQSPPASQASRLVQQTPPPLPPRRAHGASPHLNWEEHPGISQSVETAKVSGYEVELDEQLSDEVKVNAGTLESTISSNENAPPPLPPRRISSTA
ncbi:hypothetical protein D9756_005827 [Leucocoprinus leucothites]|uniref:SMP-LTD domain-containing protein n=1 Tax=Leucocoprinus leucothites TaxID=201217 RepID=A0A8H5FX45_9AGAR|nr:hypothetical protein D9756_005827 [Leucoagaricus leucothites]